MTVTLVIFCLYKSRFKNGIIMNPRQLKNDALADVVYLIPTVAKTYMTKMRNDSTNAFSRSVLLSSLNFLRNTRDRIMDAITKRMLIMKNVGSASTAFIAGKPIPHNRVQIIMANVAHLTLFAFSFINIVSFLIKCINLIFFNRLNYGNLKPHSFN